MFTAKTFAVASSVWPSAGARAAAPVPIMVAPPPWFSMMTGWPSAAAMRGAIMRAIWSVDPPAG